MKKENELYLVFNTDQNKKKTIIVSNPRADVTKQEAEAAMKVILEKNIFHSTTGALASVVEARLHTSSDQVLA